MTVNETHVFGPALVNEARFGYNRLNISFNPNTLVDTGALGINVGQTQNPIALPEIPSPDRVWTSAARRASRAGAK
jgi:hypothetical protein